MTGKDWIKINGVSSDTVNIWVDTPPAPPMPKRRVTISQTGIEEDAAVKENSYENSTLNVVCYSFYPEDFDNSDIYSYILGARTIELSRQQGWYYKVRNVTCNNPAVSADGARLKYTFAFQVAPFRYKLDNEPEVMTGNVIDITNECNFFSRPRIELTATGDITFDCNGDYFYLYGCPEDSEVIIDSERLVTLINNEIVNASTNGKYPLLNVGANRIAVSGTCSNVTIYKNERKV